MDMSNIESVRVDELRRAQDKAVELFNAIEARGLIRAGVMGTQLKAEIFALAHQMYNVTTHWHKRIDRSTRSADPSGRYTLSRSGPRV